MAFRASFERFGLLRPLLCADVAGRLTLVAGHRRSQALGEFGVERVPVRAVPGLPRSDLWDLLLEDQLISGPLNPAEVGLYARLRFADTGETSSDLLDRVLPRLGLPSRSGALDDFLWVADLPEQNRTVFAEGRLPVQGVRVLARAPRVDALAVLDLLAEARVGVNKFSELARWLFECAWGEGVGVREWLQREDLARSGGQPEELRREVRRRRYPRLAEWEKGFARAVGGAGLPQNVRISHAAGFEGGRFACNANFSGLDDLESSLVALLEAVRAGRLDGLTRYLE